MTQTNFTIINDECITAMKKLPDNSIDSIITDPPYNVKMADWDAFKTNFEFSEWMEKVAKECYRILKPGGLIAVFSAARTYQFTAIAFDKAGFKCRDMIEWVYFSGMPKGKNLKGCHEPIYLGLKGEVGEMTFNIDACRIPVKAKPKRGSKDTEVVSVGNLQMEVKTVDEGVIY